MKRESFTGRVGRSGIADDKPWKMGVVRAAGAVVADAGTGRKRQAAGQEFRAPAAGKLDHLAGMSRDRQNRGCQPVDRDLIGAFQPCLKL